MSSTLGLRSNYNFPYRLRGPDFNPQSIRLLFLRAGQYGHEHPVHSYNRYRDSDTQSYKGEDWAGLKLAVEK
jgi:hypothetical protein